MTIPKITVNGTITRIVQLETRQGKSFLRVHVTSPELSIDVDVFSRDQCLALHNAMPGDRLRASGSGYHRGPLHKGKTSLTARSIHHEKDLTGRAARKRPEQLSLFSA